MVGAVLAPTDSLQQLLEITVFTWHLFINNIIYKRNKATIISGIF